MFEIRLLDLRRVAYFWPGVDSAGDGFGLPPQDRQFRANGGPEWKSVTPMLQWRVYKRDDPGKLDDRTLIKEAIVLG